MFYRGWVVVRLTQNLKRFSFLLLLSRLKKKIALLYINSMRVDIHLFPFPEVFKNQTPIKRACVTVFDDSFSDLPASGCLAADSVITDAGLI